jgi:hypothetical protein
MAVGLQHPDNQGDPQPRGLPRGKEKAMRLKVSPSQGLASHFSNVPISGMGSMKCHLF